MQNAVYLVSSLTGGGDGALDKIDGADLVAGYRAIAILDDITRFYVLVSSSVLAESSPDIIGPDTNGTDLWWVQVMAAATSSTSPIEFSGYDATGYPITEAEEATLDSNDAFARGRNHTITEDPAYPEYSWACAILSGDSNSITMMQEGCNVIAGGATNEMYAVEYSSILSGGWNNITGDSSDPAYNCLICGGESNLIECTAGWYEYNTIVGGSGNSIGGYASRCFIGGGEYNEIEGSSDTVFVGWGVICGGDSNRLYSDRGFIGAGDYNVITDTSKFGFIGNGDSNEVSGKLGSVLNGAKVSAYLYGQTAFGANEENSLGQAQHSFLTSYGTTTSGTETEIFLDADSVQMVLPSGRTWKFTIDIVARQAAGTSGTIGDSAFWTVTGGIKRDTSNNTAIVGSVQGSGTPGSNDCDADIASQGTITMSGIAVADETFVVDSQTFTWKATRSTTGEVTIGASASEAVTNIVTAITADLSTVTAVDGDGDTVLLTAVTAGAAGNSIVLTESSTNMDVDGSGTLGTTTAGVNHAGSWEVSVTADDTNESLKIAVTGEANKTIRWLAKTSLVEVG